MRILHVVPSLLRAGGGPSESVPMTAMAQRRTGLEVAIAFYDVGELSEKAREAERSGVRLIRFRGARTRLNPVAFSWDFARRFEEVARGYDVIHTHVQWMFPIWWAAHIARRLGKPYCMMPRGSFAPARLRESGWKKKLVGWIDRHYAKHAAASWATAQSEADEIRAYVPGVKTEVFPIGLDVEKYEKEKVGEVGEQMSLLFFSRISPIKGLDLLAEAWSRIQSNNPAIPNQARWKLLIVGPDDRGYTEEIKKVFAAKCPAGSFEFRGPVYGGEKIGLLSGADAFILPTRNENWGIAVAEAMASGLPVICTKGAPWHCLEVEEAGWWTDVSVEGLEKALLDLMALDAAELRVMGARGRAWVQKNLDWPVIAERMRMSYERIVRHG